MLLWLLSAGRGFSPLDLRHHLPKVMRASSSLRRFCSSGTRERARWAASSKKRFLSRSRAAGQFEPMGRRHLRSETRTTTPTGMPEGENDKAFAARGVTSTSSTLLRRFGEDVQELLQRRSFLLARLGRSTPRALPQAQAELQKSRPLREQGW
jgi:hypothetical protein